MLAPMYNALVCFSRKVFEVFERLFLWGLRLCDKVTNISGVISQFYEGRDPVNFDK